MKLGTVLTAVWNRLGRKNQASTCPVNSLLLYSFLFCFLNFSFSNFLSSCQRRPLEVYYLDRARLVLHVDWMSEFGVRPYGMTVNIYNDADALVQRFVRNEIDSLALTLPVGRYRVVVSNGELDGFPSFGFRDADNFEGFRSVAYDNAARNSLAMLAPSWDYGTRYSWEPDELLGAAVDSFFVTQDLIDRQLQFLEYHDRDEAVGHTSVQHVYTTVFPLQPMIHIRVHVNGMENMYRMQASLSGMADGCSMSHTWRNPTECTVFYDTDRWSYRFDGDNSKHGWMYIDIPTWGEPRGQELQEGRDSLQNVLKMNFTLRDKDHSERFWAFNVGHLIEYKDPQRDPRQLTPPDVLRHLYLEINREIPLLPDVPPDEEMGAGFNAHVDPWEYGGEVDLGTF